MRNPPSSLRKLGHPALAQSPGCVIAWDILLIEVLQRFDFRGSLILIRGQGRLPRFQIGGLNLRRQRCMSVPSPRVGANHHSRATGLTDCGIAR